MACTYQNFFPQIVASIAEKKRTDHGFDEDELRAVAAVAFKDTVKQFARDSRALRQRILIDTYAGVRYYPFDKVEGGYILKVEEVFENRSCFPKGSLVDARGITLVDCPDADVNAAWAVEVSIIPSGEVCEVDEEFCDTYQKPILAGIMQRLSMQVARPWYDLALAALMMTEYNSAVEMANRETINRITVNNDGDYTGFMQEMMPILANTNATTSPNGGNIHESLQEDELRSIVEASFKSSVIEFCSDTRLYRTELALDIYRDVKYYPIVAPSGFHIHEIEALKHDHTNVPVGTQVDQKSITLPECPTVDRASAFRVEVSLIPRYDMCNYDPAFIDRFHAAILDRMIYTVLGQKNRTWYDSERSGFHLGRYNGHVADAERDSMNTIPESGLGDYTKFLAGIAASIVPLEGENRMRESVVRAAVQTAFRDTVIDFARQSGLYKVRVPVDVYKGVSNYTIEAPCGFHVLEITHIEEVECSLPQSAKIDGVDVTIPPPARDIPMAWVVTMSVIPSHNTCVFDLDFIDRYYDAIQAGIFARLTAQDAKAWRSNRSGSWKQTYGKLITSAKRKNITGLVKTTKERISDY